MENLPQFGSRANAGAFARTGFGAVNAMLTPPEAAFTYQRKASELDTRSVEKPNVHPGSPGTVHGFLPAFQPDGAVMSKG
ncbi:hypothetical protein X770_32360 [Mesorhizobium sp. LSJC269B00]|nr:hypothetical protein X770_32360 [Mesorhizobium sp. LSJC269B00]